jgi:predicted DNA-binding transcriptional regulator YafY
MNINSCEKKFVNLELLNSNFISLTGYRVLLIFKSLLKSPKTILELREELLSDKYVNEPISDDTIRTYINSLRSIGCKISKATKLSHYRYKLIRHPFEIDIDKQSLEALHKVFKRLKDLGNIEKLEIFECFILKMCNVIRNKDTKNYLLGMVIVNKLDRIVYEQITECCKNNLGVTLLYESAGLSKQYIEMLCQKLFLKSGNIYIEGYNIKHKNYSSLLVKRIKQIVAVKPVQNTFLKTDKNIICEIYDKDYVIEDDDELIRKESNKLIIKIDGSDEFRAIQKILYLADNCKVIQPQSFRLKLIHSLEEMQKIYD